MPTQEVRKVTSQNAKSAATNTQSSTANAQPITTKNIEPTTGIE
jgi:hypothetical protein